MMFFRFAALCAAVVAAAKDLTLCDKSSMLQTGRRAEQPCGFDRDCPQEYAIKEVSPHPQVNALFSTSPALRLADPSKTIVFYNLFVKEPDDIPRVANLSRHQLSHLNPDHHQLWINSIGAVKDIQPHNTPQSPSEPHLLPPSGGSVC